MNNPTQNLFESNNSLKAESAGEDLKTQINHFFATLIILLFVSGSLILVKKPFQRGFELFKAVKSGGTQVALNKTKANPGMWGRLKDTERVVNLSHHIERCFDA